MKKARKSLIVFLVSLLVGVTAALTVPDRSLGGSISYDVGIHQEGPGGSYGFLPQFDPSLGTLNSVSYTGRLDAEAEFFFAEPQGTVNYTGPVYVYLSGSDEPDIVGPVVSGTQANVGYQLTIGAPAGVPINLSGYLTTGVLQSQINPS